MVDAGTKKALQGIPLLQTKASPRDDLWIQRLKEEYQSLIQVNFLDSKNNP
jgi:Ubiquitin-fold modifier-conjugating enzyme 1